MTNDAAAQLRILWNRRWWLAAFAVVAAVAGFVLSGMQSDTYRASATVQLTSGRQLSGQFVAPEELLQLTNLGQTLARTPAVRHAAVRRLGTVARRPGMDISTNSQVQLLIFTASGRDPKVAARYANAYAAAFIDYLETREDDQRTKGLQRIQQRVAQIEDELSRRGGPAPTSATAVGLNAEVQALQSRAADLQASLGDSGRVIQPATAPGSPSSPRPKRDAILAAMAALVLGAIVVYLLARYGDRYGSAEDAARDLDLPLLVELPRRPDGDPVAVEAFRSLRTAVVFRLRELRRPILIVTSAAPSAGKTYVVAGLGRAFAAEGHRAVIVDGDLRKPALHQRVGASLQPGIGDLLRDGSDAQQLSTQPLRVSAGAAARGGSFDFIAAGGPVHDTAEALSSSRMRQALAALRQAYDVAVVDSPPVLAVVDAVSLSRFADGVLVVVDARRDRRADVRRAVQTLRGVDAPILGLVFNKSESASVSRYAHYGDEQERDRGTAPATA